jgi:beta-glucosidase
MHNYILIAAIAFTLSANAQIYKDPKSPVEDRVADLLSKMTLEEKIDYIGGHNDFYIRGIERLGLPEIKMTDGPVGTRNYGSTTAYPASVLTAATWDTNLSYRLGEALGKDARERGVHILLAPGVNIYRAPMNGRNFEYLGEDPYLAGEMAVAYIKGVQSRNVVATVKHFAGNNQEWDRNNVSSDIDERTLQEIYLPAFKAAVQKGHVGAVMNSYNLVNGVHATQQEHLNNDILKGNWKFDGILMSDWVATYDGVAAAKGGLDLEMPSAAFMNKANLLPAIKNGTLSEEVINDKVRRILRIIFRFGFYDTEYKMTEPLKDNPENDKVALDLARAGIVLLKNEGNLLPLAKSIKTIAVIGPNANVNVAGGGSSYTKPFHSVTLLDGIKAAAPGAKVVFVSNAIPQMEDYIDDSPVYTAKGSKTKGVKAEYFNNQDLQGKPVASVTETSINHDWPDVTGIKGLGTDHFSARYTGVVRPARSGLYKFAVRGDDGFRLYVDDKLVVDMWADHAPTLKGAELQLEAGKEYNFRLEFYENAGGAVISFAVYTEVIDFADAFKAAASADVAIVSVGFGMSGEGEGSDRTFELPEYHAQLVNAVTKANPNTVVVLNAGGNVYMQNWLPQVKGLLHAWFPGQEGGTAIAEILFGTTNPSGKLPASFEKKWEDNPTYNNYYDADKDKRVSYKEGLNVGYRYYDHSTVKPQFPFGFGLSYTTFEYSDLKVTNNGGTNMTVTYTLKNTGRMDGAESSQVYVHQTNTPVERPVKELKGFSKVFLKKGESQTVTVKLDADAFSYYKVDKAAFGYDPGTFEVIVGASSEDIRLRGNVTVK